MAQTQKLPMSYAKAARASNKPSKNVSPTVNNPPPSSVSNRTPLGLSAAPHPSPVNGKSNMQHPNHGLSNISSHSGASFSKNISSSASATSTTTSSSHSNSTTATTPSSSIIIEDRAVLLEKEFPSLHVDSKSSPLSSDTPLNISVPAIKEKTLSAQTHLVPLQNSNPTLSAIVSPSNSAAISEKSTFATTSSQNSTHDLSPSHALINLPSSSYDSSLAKKKTIWDVRKEQMEQAKRHQVPNSAEITTSSPAHLEDQDDPFVVKVGRPAYAPEKMPSPSHDLDLADEDVWPEASAMPEGSKTSTKAPSISTSSSSRRPSLSSKNPSASIPSISLHNSPPKSRHGSISRHPSTMTSPLNNPSPLPQPDETTPEQYSPPVPPRQQQRQPLAYSQFAIPPPPMQNYQPNVYANPYEAPFGIASPNSYYPYPMYNPYTAPYPYWQQSYPPPPIQQAPEKAPVEDRGALLNNGLVVFGSNGPDTGSPSGVPIQMSPPPRVEDTLRNNGKVWEFGFFDQPPPETPPPQQRSTQLSPIDLPVPNWPENRDHTYQRGTLRGRRPWRGRGYRGRGRGRGMGGMYQPQPMFERDFPPPQLREPPPFIPLEYPPPPVPLTPLSFPLDATRYYLLGQLEYYLSPTNMERDFFLRSRMSPYGWIPIALIASFNRVTKLTNDIRLIRDVLSLSRMVELHYDPNITQEGYEGDIRVFGWENWILHQPSSAIAESITTNTEEVPEEDEEVEFVLG